MHKHRDSGLGGDLRAWGQGLMCGIAAIAVGSQTDIDKGAIDRMVARLVHRGPDANRWQCLPGCHLGHTRLSVIDLETGSQPMVDASDRYWITFNGEIYNYKELRKHLVSKGHPFRTQSDTEVILRAYSEWGPPCLDRLRGMFAFAIWDTERQVVFAARDLFGEKPLYYALLPDGALVLASEIKALLASGLVVPELDLDAIDAFLALGYVPPDRTAYRNVESLRPGHYLEWQAGHVAVTRYWKPKLTVGSIALQDAAARLRELMVQAVRRQTVADVPVGAFLSGGVDSSTIVALMSLQAPAPVRTFSVGFGELINELPYARLVAHRYSTEHHEINLEIPPLGELFHRVSEAYDEPFGDSSSIPTYLMSEFARRHVKVVLSGDGGDELFGGYEWYQILLKSEADATPWSVRATLGLLGRGRYLIGKALGQKRGSGKAVDPRRQMPSRARARSDAWTRHVASRLYFSEAERTRLWGPARNRVNSFAPGSYYMPEPGTRGIDQAFYFDLTSYLPGDILVKVDRAAMAHGLETRTPFLDRDLVEFALSLPAQIKVTDADSKIIMRTALSEYWPPGIRTRPKQGFGVPFATWLSDPEIRELTLGVFAPGSRLRHLLPGLQSDSVPLDSYQAWLLLTLGVWLEKHPAAVA